MKLKDIEWKKQITIPNGLSLIRLGMIPVMAYHIVSMEDRRFTGFILFLLIWTTDALDGFIARTFNQISELGMVLDPLVDKIFQITTGICLYIVGRLPLWVPLIMITKELLLVIGGAVLFKKRDVVVGAQWFGKLTTILLVAAFSFAMLLPDSQIYLIPYLFIVPVSMSVFSLISYVRYYVEKDKADALKASQEQNHKDLHA